MTFSSGYNQAYAGPERLSLGTRLESCDRIPG